MTKNTGTNRSMDGRHAVLDLFAMLMTVMFYGDPRGRKNRLARQYGCK